MVEGSLSTQTGFPGPCGRAQELKRSLSFADLMAYGLVFIVPISPVAVFGIVFNISHGMAPLVYLVGTVAMLFTALSYMAMSSVFPSAGSVHTYASRALGPVIGFFAGWAILLDYLLFPTLTYVGGAIAIHSAVPELPRQLCVVGMLVVVTAVNCFGIKTTAKASFILLVFQLTLLAIFAVLGAHAVLAHVGGAQLSLAPFYNPAEFKLDVIFGALSLAVLSFLGFDAISTLSEESSEGASAIGRATILSLCLSAALFVGQTWLASMFLPGKTRLPPGDASDAAFYNIATLVGGYWYKFILAVPGVCLSGIAGAITSQTATARILLGMARDGDFPRALAYVDPRRGVPLRAVLLVSALTLATAMGLIDHLQLLVSMVSFGALLGFLTLHTSVIAHFVWRMKSRRWIRHLVVPAAGLAIVGYVLVNAPANAKLSGAIWLAAGAVMLIVRKRAGRIAGRKLVEEKGA